MSDMARLQDQLERAERELDRMKVRRNQKKNELWRAETDLEAAYDQLDEARAALKTAESS